jgi:hypothetical protein
MCLQLGHAIKIYSISYVKLDKFTASALGGAECSVSPSSCCNVSLTEGCFSAHWLEGCEEPKAGLGMMEKGQHTFWESNAHCPFYNQ